MKLTKLEKIVSENPHATWEALALLGGTTPGAMQRACDRLMRKESIARREIAHSNLLVA